MGKITFRPPPSSYQRKTNRGTKISRRNPGRGPKDGRFPGVCLTLFQFINGGKKKAYLGSRRGGTGRFVLASGGETCPSSCNPRGCPANCKISHKTKNPIRRAVHAHQKRPSFSPVKGISVRYCFSEVEAFEHKGSVTERKKNS